MQYSKNLVFSKSKKINCQNHHLFLHLFLKSFKECSQMINFDVNFYVKFYRILNIVLFKSQPNFKLNTSNKSSLSSKHIFTACKVSS